jgi:hypothetical protein
MQTSRRPVPLTPALGLGVLIVGLAPETQAAIRRILLIARFDVAVLLLVIADMVTKPFS